MSEELLDAPVRTPDQLRQVDALCPLVEMATVMRATATPAASPIRSSRSWRGASKPSQSFGSLGWLTSVGMDVRLERGARVTSTTPAIAHGEPNGHTPRHVGLATPLRVTRWASLSACLLD